MNNKLLTGNRQLLFLTIAENPGICRSQLCAKSRARGGELARINHNLVGLIDEGFIQVTCHHQPGRYQYKITRSKGRQMLKYLQECHKHLAIAPTVCTET
jgi:hypothetical protein